MTNYAEVVQTTYDPDDGLTSTTIARFVDDPANPGPGYAVAQAHRWLRAYRWCGGFTAATDGAVYPRFQVKSGYLTEAPK